ncbi:MAG: tRNA lysidine(34) synthetase TilS [Bacillota bacterium]
MLDDVRRCIMEHGLIQPGEAVLAAVSGGADSLALCHALWRLREELGFTLRVAHLNHMFRGAEAKADADHVAAFAAGLGLEAFIAQADVPGMVRGSGQSAQALARQVRYAFLRRTAAQTGSSRIATGHTADDQAETVLLRLLRGAGLDGLAGIRPERAGIIRPLLHVGRKQVEEYCRAEGLAWRDDPSNQTQVYDRNRVRHRLLPVLEEFNPAVRAALCETAALLQADQAVLEQETSHALCQATTAHGLDVGALRGLPLGLRRRVLLTAARSAGAQAGHAHVAALVELVDSGQTGQARDLPGNVRASLSYGQLEFMSSLPAEAPPLVEQELTIPGVTRVPELELEVVSTVRRRLPGDEQPATFALTARFDYNSVVRPLTARTRRAGDRFWPAGAPGTKKLKDFLIDAKVPRAARDRLLIICAADSLLWVGGVRQAQHAHVTPATGLVLELTLVYLADEAREEVRPW